jgi:REP element-mobilizing transposase RayT
MARPLRVEYPGALYHIFSRGNEKGRIFGDRQDYLSFESLLERLCPRFRSVIHGYVLMPNHYHLIVETKEPNLSSTIHWLNTTHSIRFNRRHERVGHVFQGRFKSILVEKGEYLLHLSRYIHLNPQRKRIIKDLGSYPWSSFKGFLNEKDEKEWVCYDWILSQFDEDVNQAREKYTAFVAEGLSKDIPNPFKEVQKGFILGSQAFIDQISSRMDCVPHHEIPYTRNFKKIWAIEDIIALVADYFQVDSKILLKSNSKRNLPRRIAIHLARYRGGLDNKSIGQVFNIGYSAVSESIKSLREKMKQSSTVRAEVTELENRLK